MDDRIFKNLPPSKFYFENFENPQKFSFKNPRNFCFTIYSKRTCSQYKWKMGTTRRNSLVYIIVYIQGVPKKTAVGVSLTEEKIFVQFLQLRKKIFKQSTLSLRIFLL